MVLGLVAYRVPRSGMGARRQTGRSPANSSGTVLLLYPRVLLQDVLFSSQLGSPADEYRQTGGNARSGDAGERHSRPDAPRPISLACGYIATHGGTQGVAGIVDIRRLSEQRESTLAPRGADIPGRPA